MKTLAQYILTLFVLLYGIQANAQIILVEPETSAVVPKVLVLEGQLDVSSQFSQLSDKPSFDDILRSANYSVPATIKDENGITRKLTLLFYKQSKRYWHLFVLVNGADIAGYNSGDSVFFGQTNISLSAKQKSLRGKVSFSTKWKNASTSSKIMVLVNFKLASKLSFVTALDWY